MIFTLSVDNFQVFKERKQVQGCLHSHDHCSFRQRILGHPHLIRSVRPFSFATPRYVIEGEESF